MNIFATAVAVILLGLGVFVNQTSVKQRSSIEKSNTDVLSLETQRDGHNDIDVNDPISIPSSSPTPSNIFSSNQVSISDFVYPNAEVFGRTDVSLEMASNDKEDIITNWYKDLITEKGLSVRNTISTNTNGNISNKLTGTSADTTVLIDIVKNADESKVLINIEITK